MRARVLVESIILSDGGEVSVPASGVVVIVGPNNAGKSRLLRDVAASGTGAHAGQVATEVRLRREGSVEDLVNTFYEDGTISTAANGAEEVQTSPSQRTPLQLITQVWKARVGGSAAVKYFIYRADTESRLAASQPTSGADLFRQKPSHPIHYVYQQRELEDRISEISREAFGDSLVLDTWTGGTGWAFRVGGIDLPSSPRPSKDYLDVLKTLPLLHEQGDGVRSMIGLLLNFLTGHQSIALIDEPEAFLHPPQARYLGRLLSEQAASSEGQVFVATHSSDVVHGLLSGPAPATLIRLVRDGNVNHSSVLSNAAVRELWDDPLLRYSNLLEGLFADGVVLCESDVDCRFFAAVLDSTSESDGGTREPDVHFTSCGGKHRLHVAVRALKAVSVPVSVIVDFDVLNDWATLSRLAGAAGCEVESIEPHWRVLDSALRSQDRVPTVAGLREAMNVAFGDITSPKPEKRDLEALRAILQIDNGWTLVKNTGLNGVPKGDAYQAAFRLIEELAKVGVHVIPVGEMEDLLPSASGHGARWLASVLSERLHETDASAGARLLAHAALSTIYPAQAP